MAGLPILGVDATSAGTQAILVQDGEVIHRTTETGMDVMLDPKAFDKLALLVKESGATVAGIGVAGLNSPREAALLEMRLRSETGVSVTVGDDTETAQLGAFNGGPGIVVIAHSGSNSFGRDATGRAARSGGHGHLVGDEGSLYWIASRAVRLALRSRDGRGRKSQVLEDAVKAAYGTDLPGVVTRVTAAAGDPSVVVRVAKALMDVDDPVARSVLDDASDDLVAHVTALRAALGNLPVAMYGSVFQNAYLRQRFVAATNAIDAMNTPVFGAVVLASNQVRDRDMGWH
jgi:N-acetylglucosamine kinase-like BadF-type ATPase